MLTATSIERDTVLKQMRPFDNGERPLVKYPQKRPLLRLTTRPPQLETPFAVFNESVLTPNDAFFVRYHLTLSPPATCATSSKPCGSPRSKLMKLSMLTASALWIAILSLNAADAWKLPPETARLKPGPGVKLATG